MANGAAYAGNAGAAAAATTGIQGQVNQEVYQGKLSTALLRAIDLARARAAAPIKEGLRDPICTGDQLVLDVSRCHGACSLMTGLTELTSALENRSMSAVQLKLRVGEPETMKKGADPAKLKAVVDAQAKLVESFATVR